MLPAYLSSLLPMPSNVAIHTYETRNATVPRIPIIKHKFAKQGIRYRYLTTLNSMPSEYKEKLRTHSFDGFKKYFKIKTVYSYNMSCDIQHCYVCRSQDSNNNNT
jgi:hypothetical protein